MVAGSTENPCMSGRRPREPSRSPIRRTLRPPEPPGPPPRRPLPPTPPDPPRRGIRGGAAARRRREAYIANSGGDRATVPIVHAGGQRRPLGTSRFWEPSASEASGEETDEVEFVAFTAAVDLTSLQAEHLVPRSRLYNPYVFDHSHGSLRPQGLFRVERIRVLLTRLPEIGLTTSSSTTTRRLESFFTRGRELTLFTERP